MCASEAVAAKDAGGKDIFPAPPVKAGKYFLMAPRLAAVAEMPALASPGGRPTGGCAEICRGQLVRGGRFIVWGLRGSPAALEQPG